MVVRTLCGSKWKGWSPVVIDSIKVMRPSQFMVDRAPEMGDQTAFNNPQMGGDPLQHGDGVFTGSIQLIKSGEFIRSRMHRIRSRYCHRCSRN